MRIGPAPVRLFSCLSAGFALACDPGGGAPGVTVTGEPGLLESSAARPVTPVLAEEPPPEFGDYPGVRHGGNYMHNYYLPPAPGTTPWFPSWSPDGASLAVGMAGSVWEVDVDTGNATELTRGGTYHSSPSYSPDGRWIVYTADYGGERIQLEILDTETGETRALTDDRFVYADPVFSPDGGRIAYVSSAPNGLFNVYIREVADGDWAGPEIAVSSDNSYGNNRLYFGPMDMHLSPAWMPDGEELLLVSNRDVPLGSGNVIRVPARADGIREARTVLREQTLYRARPDVSIDGRRFVYSSTAGAADQFNNLYVQPTEGGEPYKLTFFEHDAFHPRWSPDGEMIAYITNGGRAPATRTHRDLRRSAAEDRDRRARVRGADGHAVRHGAHGREREGRGSGTRHTPGAGREVPRPARRIRAHRPARALSRLPHRRDVHRRAPAGRSGPHHREGL